MIVARRRAPAILLALLLLGCPPLPPETIPEATAPADPSFLIGLLADRPSVQVSSSLGMRVIDPDEGILTALPPGSALRASASGDTVLLADERLPELRRRSFRIEVSDSAGLIAVDGRFYRGSLELRPGAGGLQVVNRVPLEQYLVGVVSAEMGIRDAGEVEALKAQAVAARTYALRNRGRWATLGFDLTATVSDQVYTGVAAENAFAATAVAATRGTVLTFEGALVEAFYFSTCSGHTEAGEDAFSGTPRPYLRSIADVDSTGTPWCAISPRFTWTEQWSGTQLAAVLRRTLVASGLDDRRAGDLTDIRIVDRTATHRVATLELAGRGGRTVVTGQDIRNVLGPVAGGILRSNDFTIKLTRSGGRLTRVEVSGRGNGHGVGMCQWGAIGRARAGQDYQTILTSYFPGTELTKMY